MRTRRCSEFAAWNLEGRAVYAQGARGKDKGSKILGAGLVELGERCEHDEADSSGADADEVMKRSFLRPIRAPRHA